MMKKALLGIWWLALAGLLITAGAAVYKELEFGRVQEKQIMDIGQDIVAHPDNWKSATIGDYDAFHWWKNVDVGHGMTVLVSKVTLILLLATIVHLAVTLTFVHFQNRKARPKGEHNQPSEATR
jgi:hypothetical protein